MEDTAPARCPDCGGSDPHGDAPCPALAALAPLGGRYQLLARLGEGGMGVVYAARHTELGTRAAVKVLHEEYAQSAAVVRRFRTEAAQCAALDHPGVVKVFDFGVEADGRCYFVMERLRGEPLDARVERDGAVAWPRAVAIVREALEALAFAHGQGLVHRDLKPENLFMARDSERDERVKIIDFGIAKVAAEAGPTQTGSILGSPRYMSPEQARDAKSVDLRTDLWAMGAVLYELLTGRCAVEGEGVMEVLTNLSMDRVARRPSAVAPSVPEWLDAVVEKALAREVDERFESAAAFSAALAQPAASRGRESVDDTVESIPADAAPHRPTITWHGPVTTKPDAPRRWARPLVGAAVALGALALALRAASVDRAPTDRPATVLPALVRDAGARARSTPRDGVACRQHEDCHADPCGPCEPGALLPSGAARACATARCERAEAVCSSAGVCVVGPNTRPRVEPTRLAVAPPTPATRGHRSSRHRSDPDRDHRDHGAATVRATAARSVEPSAPSPAPALVAPPPAVVAPPPTNPLATAVPPQF